MKTNPVADELVAQGDEVDVATFPRVSAAAAIFQGACAALASSHPAMLAAASP
jgi:hypothetical protein